MTLTVGSRLGSYEILSPLGAGGMGEVYRAKDTRLGRDVALKILPATFASDPERLARFRREAQVLAALNHPNIAGIYGLDEADGQHFLTLELVDGETLAVRLKTRAPLVVDEALAIARQIVDGLEAAHEKGIVHRDLKPANLAFDSAERLKILDFGLAKALEPAVASDQAMSPTLTFAATQAGVILGTAAYMSPEQAKGRPADKRSDVWSFGCVLFEMLAGKRAFEAEDVSDTLAAVLRGEPDWSALPAAVSAAIRTIIKRCVEKDRKARIPDMSVIRFLMADADAVPSTATMPGTHTPRAHMAWKVVGAAVTAAAVASFATWVIVQPSSAPRPRTVRFSVTADARPSGVGGPDRYLAISPDGTRIVSANGATLGGGGQLMVRRIDQLDAVPLRGLANVRAPFISPDSRWIGFFEVGELKKVPMNGGAPITICPVTGGTRGSSWGPDDTIVFASNDATTGLFSVPAQGGGQPKLLTTPDASRGEIDHFFPSILPDGRSVLFTVLMSGSVDNAEIALLDLRTGRRKTLIRGGSNGEYVEVTTPTGKAAFVLYASGGALRAIRFDRDRLEATGDPLVVADQVRIEASGAAQFSVSRDGSLVYVTGGTGSFENRSLVWVDRQGREQPINLPPRAYALPRISPDGTRVALFITDQDLDIWILDLPHLTLSRLTFGASLEQSPVWSADGQRILFSSTRAGIPNVFWQAADHTGAMEQVTKSQTLVVPYSVSPDGNKLVVSTAGGTDIGIVRFDRPHEVTPLIEGPGGQTNAEISPDGHWIAYQSNESGQFHIYVRPFPDVNAGRWQITTTPGSRPVWARNGRELFYMLGSNAAMMSVPVQTTPTFTYGNPAKLFESRYVMALPGRTFDVSPDGQKFLMIKAAEVEDRNVAQPTTIVVLNWIEELKQRLATR